MIPSQSRWSNDDPGPMRGRPSVANDVLLDAQALTRSYTSGHSTITALAAATCAVKTGERIALVGPSGSGKSTLLQLFGGLDTPTSGMLSWPGLGSRTSLRPLEVAYVFQTPSLLAPLNVVENVTLPLLLAQMNRPMAQKLALDMLAYMELMPLAEHLPEELSGGQAQRVAIARALVVRPQLLLADEPTGHLDGTTAQHVMTALLDALERCQTACVIATHDLVTAARLPIRWKMDHGRLEV